MCTSFRDTLLEISRKFNITPEDVMDMYTDELDKIPEVGGSIVLNKDLDTILDYLIFRVIEANLKSKRHLEESLTDALTGIGNRRAFNNDLDKHIGIHTRKKYDAKKYTFFLVFFDLDDFKDINDFFGHQKGDLVLQAVAQKVSAALRPTESFFRFGGEEFVVIVEDEIEPSTELANRIQKLIAEIDLSELGINTSVRSNITASVGVISHNEENSAEEIINLLSLKMTTAKRKGKNRVHA